MKRLDSRASTVGELREFIKDMPDDAVVVVPGSGHSYRKAYMPVLETASVEDGCLGEDCGAEYASDPENYQQVKVLVFGS